MTERIIHSPRGVTLVGGGPFDPKDLRLAQSLAPRLVAADGGADALLAANLTPEAVIGDLDSLSGSARQAFADRLWRVEEQITTDFDKALRHIDAPFTLGVGFLGGRLDHSLAALTTLTQHPDRFCILMGEEDITFLCPPKLRLNLPIGTRVSLYPMTLCKAKSQGLLWPLEGLELEPNGRIGTSNETSRPEIELTLLQGSLLVILPRDGLQAVLTPFHGG